MKKELKGKIDLLFDRDHGLQISVKDVNSNVTFLELKVSPEDVCALLSRQVMIPCYMTIAEIEKVGKYHRHKKFEFLIDTELPSYDSGYREVVKQLAIEKCPDGWMPDLYFGSKDSFFKKDGQDYARCIIRQYIDEPVEDEK